MHKAVHSTTPGGARHTEQVEMGVCSSPACKKIKEMILGVEKCGRQSMSSPKMPKYSYPQLTEHMTFHSTGDMAADPSVITGAS